MTRLEWDLPSAREYEIGLDRGAVYLPDGTSYLWNGLLSVDETVEGSESAIRHLDGVRRRGRVLPGEFAATVRALTAPEVLLQRKRVIFGLTYRVQTAHGHKIHLVYNALLAPASRSYVYETPTEFEWGLTTQSRRIENDIRVSHLIIETGTAYSTTVSDLEDVLYGTESLQPRLPSPEEVLEIFEDNSILRITDNGDGTWTATGPDEAIQMVGEHGFEITWPSAVWISENEYRISSL